MNARNGLVSFSLILFSSSLIAADEPPEELTPKSEEVQKATQQLSELFSYFAAPSPPPVQPDWYPLKAGDAKRVDDVLAEWTKNRAEKARGLRCQFKKWEFDPAFGPRDPKTPYRFSEGEFWTDASDVWMWREKRAIKAVTRGDKTEWVRSEVTHGARNHSVLFEMEPRQQRLIERRIGKDDVTIGIWPLLSSASMSRYIANHFELLQLNPDGLQERFWIRPVDHAKKPQDEHWLEMVPKRPADVSLCSSLRVCIAQSDWEVHTVDIRAPNYSGNENPSHTEIEFVNRKRVPPTKADSFEPKLPAGWRRIVDDLKPAPQ